MTNLLDYHDFLQETFEETRKGFINNVTNRTLTAPSDFNAFFTRGNSCCFCKKPLKEVFHRIMTLNRERDFYDTLDIFECDTCGWWVSKWDSKEYKDLIEEVDGYHRIIQKFAIVKTFDVCDKELPIKALVEEVRKDKELLYQIDPYKFEELAQYVFSAFFNCEVEHVGKSHDGGIDLLIINSDSPILVQVKRRRNPNQTEPVETIRDFIGAMYLQDAKKGIVLSTARKFSGIACDNSKKMLDDKKFEYFDLINFQRFCGMVDVIKKDSKKRWQDIIEIQYFA